MQELSVQIQEDGIREADGVRRASHSPGRITHHSRPVRADGAS